VDYLYNYKNNRYLPGNNRNVLEHNRQIFGELGNSIIGKIKSMMYQCLIEGLGKMYATGWIGLFLDFI